MRILLVILFFIIISSANGQGVKLSFPESEYGFGKWDFERYGNYRAVVEVGDKTNAVYIRLPWRRRDSNPEGKRVIVVDAFTNKEITNVYCPEINREFGDIIFQPETVPGKYFVYYIPYELTNHNYNPSTKYLSPVDMADKNWKASLPHKNSDKLKKARLFRFEARDKFYSVFPMEVIATKQETGKLIVSSGSKGYLLFPEYREYPIVMKDDLPVRWIKKGAFGKFSAQAQPGEYFVFQVGLFALKDIDKIDLNFKGDNIDDKFFTCFNLGGSDWLGREFEKDVPVKANQVQALWFGIQIPQDANGTLTGTITIQPLGMKESDVELEINVTGDTLENGGVDDIHKLSRLKWLNSKIGLDDEVFGIYTPVTFSGDEVGILGRKIKLDKSGLPARITSSFDDMPATINGPVRELLSSPITMVVEEKGSEVLFDYGNHKILSRATGSITTLTEGTSRNLEIECQSKIECDGYANYSVRIKAKNDCNLEDVMLEIPMAKEIAEYMMGMGRKGGECPENWEWEWSPQNNGVFWLGTVGAGLQCRLKGHDDIWSYTLPSGFLKDWYNEGKGGCTMSEKDNAFLVKVYSGSRTLKKGEELLFRFGLLVTPVRPLDNNHWSWRYWHSNDFSNMGEINQLENVAPEANIINIHHGNGINPYINYPFVATDTLKKYISSAHQLGKKVKLYYTVRELSIRAPEIFTLRSLDDEVYKPGDGINSNPNNGESWLCEHLIDDYEPAWHQYFGDGEWDVAIRQQGLSRWHNYYLEGMGWLIKKVGLDGIYIDGIGYDREIIKRLRKVMYRSNPGCLIDLHSGNSFPRWNISPAVYYMEHFPYINSLWFGEMFDYNASPDYWLVEVSGIPYGLYGEMLQGGGNVWRGMVYGMSNRLKWHGDPRAIWKLWDDFGIEKSQMLGYWSKRCPVKTGDDNIKATAYVRNDKTLIAIGSWTGDKNIHLEIDWAAVGIDKSKAVLYAPEIEGIQKEKVFNPDELIPVEKDKGWLLFLKRKNQ